MNTTADCRSKSCCHWGFRDIPAYKVVAIYFDYFSLIRTSDGLRTRLCSGRRREGQKASLSEAKLVCGVEMAKAPEKRSGDENKLQIDPASPLH